MHPYSRPSPRTASPASNLQTNPTRTNNQRHSSQEMSPYSTTPPYSDRGADESEGEMMSRGEHASESDQRHYHKVNQVIQVRTCYSTFLSMCADPCRTSSPRQPSLSYPPESYYPPDTPGTAA